MDKILRFDESLMLSINGLHHDGVDQLMWLISLKWAWIPVYALLLGWMIYRMGWRNALFIAVGVVPLIVLSDQLSGNILRHWIERPRPCHPLSGIADQVFLLSGACGGKFGFPSAHSTNFFALAAYLSLTFKPGSILKTAVFFGAASLVGFSRIYLGKHYPLDVLGGAILGIIIALIVAQVMLWLRMRLKIDQNP